MATMTTETTLGRLVQQVHARDQAELDRDRAELAPILEQITTLEAEMLELKAAHYDTAVRRHQETLRPELRAYPNILGLLSEQRLATAELMRLLAAVPEQLAAMRRAAETLTPDGVRDGVPAEIREQLRLLGDPKIRITLLVEQTDELEQEMARRTGGAVAPAPVVEITEPAAPRVPSQERAVGSLST